MAEDARPAGPFCAERGEERGGVDLESGGGIGGEVGDGPRLRDPFGPPSPFVLSEVEGRAKGAPTRSG